MRERNIEVSRGKKGFGTSSRDRDALPAPDLVDPEPCRRRSGPAVGAVTMDVPTLACFLFVAIVLDAFSRRVVGWAIANHVGSELVLDALDMALHRRKPTNVIHNSDQVASILESHSENAAPKDRPSMGRRPL
jgi:putative transposase